MSGECEKGGAGRRARTMRNDEGGESEHSEGLKREGRSKMAWKERRARAVGRWIKPARVQERTEGE